ncbi:MAG TPA: hypothetical protein VMS64_12230 [Candidatus Methylomirabilis sp.]|nr:hypothetical protein [Candidatus Methylomirabilis sp.]
MTPDGPRAITGGSATDRGPDFIELPAPTAWPMALALGVTLLFAGLVTNAIVSAVGIVLVLVASVGWWRQVLPVQRHESVPFRPVAERARPVVPTRAAVDRLRLGEAGHRVRIPVEVQPIAAGVQGGIVGGVAMAVISLAYGAIVQHSVWYPINLLSAVAMPAMAQAGIAELRAFNLTALVIGIIAHGLISVLAGLLYAVLLPMLPHRHMLWGGLVAPLLWTGGVWAVLGVINPALNAHVDWWWFIVSQIAFGLAAGFVVSRAHPVATMQTWPLAARAGVEAEGVSAPHERRR